jgi:hypothetical protein
MCNIFYCIFLLCLFFIVSNSLAFAMLCFLLDINDAITSLSYNTVYTKLDMIEDILGITLLLN